MSKPDPWELNMNDSEEVEYWKWRVRRLETMIPGLVIVSITAGFGIASCLFIFVNIG